MLLPMSYKYWCCMSIISGVTLLGTIEYCLIILHHNNDLLSIETLVVAIITSLVLTNEPLLETLY